MPLLIDGKSSLTYNGFSASKSTAYLKVVVVVVLCSCSKPYYSFMLQLPVDIGAQVSKKPTLLLFIVV